MSYYNEYNDPRQYQNSGSGGQGRPSGQRRQNTRPANPDYAMYGYTSNKDYSSSSNRRPRSSGGSKGRRGRMYSLALFMPLVLIYFEAVFTILTHNDATFLQRLMPVLFCISLGGFAYIICTITPSEKVNKIITATLLGANAVAFCVAYFILRKFGVHYDLKTVFAGAADAAGGFGDEIFKMIFSVSGILAILFLWLPFILYVWIGRKHDTAVVKSKKMRNQARIAALAAGVVFFLIARLVVLIAPSLRDAYSKEYSYESAVNNFGLLTAIRLDTLHSMGFGGGDDGFTDDTGVTVPTSTKPVITNDPSVTQAPDASPTPTPREYGPNKMNIDFAALAESASGHTKDLDEYVNSLTPTMENEMTGLFKGKNLIFLSAEAFCKEAVSEELTPTIHRLMTKGVYFKDFYQPASAGTTGGEYQNIFGMLPMDGGSSVKNTSDHNNYLTLGNIFNRIGYNGWAFHNNDYKYYKRNITHNNLGYSNGFMGYGNGMEQYVKKQWPESDDEMIRGTLPLYIDKEPFNVYYMTVSGHGIYPKSSNAMVRKHWDRVQGLSQYNDLVKGYIACNLDLEDALTYLINELEAKGKLDNTVIVMCADHFPYGLDDDAGLGKMPNLSNLYGYDVKTTWQRDHSAAILWSPCLEDMHIEIDTPASSLDILPTLCNLFDVDWDSRLFPGRDVFSEAMPLVFTTAYSWKTDICTYDASGSKVTPATPDTVIPDGYVDAVKKIVKNKVHYCDWVLETDYFRHVFKNYVAPTPVPATPTPVPEPGQQTDATTQATQNNNPAPSINVNN